MVTTRFNYYFAINLIIGADKNIQILSLGLIFRGKIFGHSRHYKLRTIRSVGFLFND